MLNDPSPSVCLPAFKTLSWGRAGAVLLAAIGWWTATPARAQVVQLPTFHSFQVQTSVLAPDRGRSYLGGLSRSSQGMISRGVPGFRGLPGLNRVLGNRAIGAANGASHSSVHATIIDHRAWDEAVRGTQIPWAPDPALAQAWQLSQRLDTAQQASAGGSARLESLAEIRRQQAETDRNATAEAERMVALARQAAAEGKPGAARILLKMAAKKAPTESQRQAWLSEAAELTAKQRSEDRAENHSTSGNQVPRRNSPEREDREPSSE